MSSSDSLDAYRRKRDFARTPEPGGKERGDDADRPIFVIQKHRASRLHYDLRIEIDGVLVSWAVPKGPSTDPRDKRLAVRVEDHPLDYAGFEGVIPDGEYGAGAVIVWDGGYYLNLLASGGPRGEGPATMAQALEAGFLRVHLEGQKVRGGYKLVHARLGGDPKNWLLIKMKGEGADARRRPTSTQPESVLSGRTIEQVAEEG